MAQQLGISQEYLSMLENGKRNYDFYIVWKVCKLLGIPLSKVEEALMSDEERCAHMMAKEQIVENCVRELLKQLEN